VSLCSIAAVPGVHAAVSVGNAFSDHMVLQQGMACPIWGKASAGEAVTVDIAGQTKSAPADAQGNWRVKLDPMPAGGPYTLTLKGSNTVTVRDVYVGEVWQCGGQSNMDTRLSFYPGYADTIRAANLPKLRYYTLRQPGETTRWEVCSPSTAGKLSAMGFFFGREIQKTQGVAVGLVVTAVGGTFISEWMDPASIAADAVLSRNGDSKNGDMYRQWVVPVVGYGIKGTVWIQGEQDRSNGLPAYYAGRFQALIKGWRKEWDQGEFPFYYVQLANYGSKQTSPMEEASSAEIREAQRLALQLPKTAMAVAIDIGAANDLHFPDKRSAGIRLSLPAQALDYGKAGLEYSGPLYRSMEIRGGKAYLVFRHTGSGMIGKGGALQGFALAASGGTWVWADEAAIHGDTIIVSSAKVPAPAKVRYAWGGNPIGNLYNNEGLPASPFRTDGPQIPVSLFRKVRRGAAAGGFAAPPGSDLRRDPLGRAWKKTQETGSIPVFAGVRK
jgi:sialate O-acetylesterase